MAQAAVTIYSWKAVHASGTKFYQVLRFVSANGRSFSIRQNGALVLFTGLGKMSTGAVDLDEGDAPGVLAGQRKIADKRAGGYNQSSEEDSYNCPNTSDAITWIRTNLGAKPQGFARDILRKPEWAWVAPVDLPAAPTPPKKSERKETDTQKHADWGSW